MVEKVVASQLNAHMLEHSLLESEQSAYTCRRNHSTESTLLRARNDILQAIDGKKCVMLVLLDLILLPLASSTTRFSAAPLVNIGVCGPALAWFRST